MTKLQGYNAHKATHFIEVAPVTGGSFVLYFCNAQNHKKCLVSRATFADLMDAIHNAITLSRRSKIPYCFPS
jgi:hypothetical protein